MEEPKKRKPYSKPQIFFEDFRLSTTIAADCEFMPQVPSMQGTCGGVKGYMQGQSGMMQHGNFFMMGITGCTTASFLNKDGVGTANSPCYYNPSEHFNVFNS